jgi:hypothetical protein
MENHAVAPSSGAALLVGGDAYFPISFPQPTSSVARGR